jgi:hypothetical protein
MVLDASQRKDSGDAGAPKITKAMVEAGVEVLRDSGRLKYEMDGVDQVLVERVLAASLRGNTCC